jgi:hypothetical protein
MRNVLFCTENAYVTKRVSQQWLEHFRDCV